MASTLDMSGAAGFGPAAHHYTRTQQVPNVFCAAQNTPKPQLEAPSPSVSVVSTHVGSPNASLHHIFSARTGSAVSTMSATNFELHELDRLSESDESPIEEPEPVPVVNKQTSSAPVHCPKMKGEAAPCLQGLRQKSHCEKTQKIIDEAHHFGLGDHYAKLMDTAMEVGFKNVKWPTGFTLFHLAAKKNCRQFVEWLLRNDFDDLHTIDDFGKKPIDYACPKKRDSVAPLLQVLMDAAPVPNTAAERKYQAIKNGTYVVVKKKLEKTAGLSISAILERADIAEGDMRNKKPACSMTAYEAETLVPAEYKKCMKMLSQGGWANMDGKWPHGGTTVLHWAARNGKEELCHFLVAECGADPKQEDGCGHDAIYHAKVKRHRKLMKGLITRFKDGLAKDAKKGRKGKL